MGCGINVMEAIWESSEKGSDDCLHYPLELLQFLYHNGFIDTSRHSVNDWVLACEPFKQPDGHYKFSKEEFLTLDPYRYSGEIKVPFDPMRINEGKYTDEGLQKLIDNAIQPSCGLAEKDLHAVMEKIKSQFRQADQLILVKADFRLAVQRLLEEHPSPLRRLEFLFDSIIKSPSAQKEIRQKQTTLRRTATPQQHAKIQKSLFFQGTRSVAELQAQKLKEIHQLKPHRLISEGENPVEGKELKRVKRSPKGIRS